LRTIEHAWATAPHLQLARIYRMIADDDAVGAYRRLEQLCGNAENRSLNHRVLAEAALEAKLWGEARDHLMHLVDRGDATRGVYQLLARLEHRE
jgi:HemY protein